jgi:hypothetical protein
MLISDRINNLIITIYKKMKTLKTNYLGKKYLEQCPKITIKEIVDKVSFEVEKQILDIELG